MSKNIIQNIVIILGILIILSFVALIYGMYLRISTPNKNLLNSPTIFSLNFEKDEKIANIEVIDKNRLLIVIDSDQGLKGAIYNLNDDKIISYINK